MKNKTVLGAAVLIGALFFTSVPCMAATPAQRVENAQTLLNNASSFDSHISMETFIKLTAAEEEGSLEMPLTFAGDLTYFKDPMKLKGNFDIDTGVFGQLTMELYSQGLDEGAALYMRMNTQDGSGELQEGTWYKSMLTAQDLSAILDFTSSPETLSTYEELGPDTINGTDTAKFHGVITGEDLQKQFEDLKILDNDTVSLDLSDILSKLSDIDINLWLDEEDRLAAQEIELTNFLQSCMDSVLPTIKDFLQQSSQEFPEFNIQIGETKAAVAMSNYDSAQDFQIPQEALDAEEVPAPDSQEP